MSTDVMHGWLYDYQNNYFAPRSFMSLIYDQNTGKTLSKIIDDEICKKSIKIDISSDEAKLFKDMSEDYGWAGITGAVENGIACGTASGALTFLTPSSSTLKLQVLTGNSTHPPKFDSLNFSTAATKDSVNVSLRTTANALIAGFNLPAASLTQAGIITCGEQEFSGTKTFENGIKGDLEGNASTASKFIGPAKITLSGDVKGEAFSEFDWTINTELIDIKDLSPGTYGGNAGDIFTIPSISVDKKGRITSAENIIIPLSDTKTDQSLTEFDGDFPILLRGISPGTSNITSATSFTSKITINPSYGNLSVGGDLTIAGASILNGLIFISEDNYGFELPSSGSPGQIFFLLVD